MIRAEALEKRFDERTAVRDVTFEISAGEVFGLLGPNGGGKTTTMRMIAGLLAPTTGRASVDGRDLYADASARASLGFLTEQPGLYDRLSALENLEFFARLYEVPQSEVRSRSIDALARFNLEDRKNDKAGSFSKGMRQRLALARTVLHQPKALLLDEPTSGLDPEAAASVRDVIAEEASRGTAIIVSTHNLAEAERLCRRVGIVKNRLLAIVDKEEASAQRILIRGDHIPMQFAQELFSIEGVTQAQVSGNELSFLTRADSDVVPDVVTLLVNRGVRVQSVVPSRRALEEHYLELVGAEPLTDDVGAVG